jgi:hypothetical protein
MHDLLVQALDRIAAKRSLGERMRLLISFLGNPPSDAACSTAARHEHDVRQGQYESFIDAQAKFDETDEELSGFSAEWDRIKSTFKVDRYRDHKGIIRRTSIPERNFRQDFELNWKSRDAQFRAVFDAFCCRWNLYGIQEVAGSNPVGPTLSNHDSDMVLRKSGILEKLCGSPVW